MLVLGMNKKRGRRAVRVLLVNRLRVLTVAVVAAGALDVSSIARAADMPARKGAETIHASTACRPNTRYRLLNPKFGWLRSRICR